MKLLPLIAKRIELEKNQRLSRQKLEAQQLSKFRKLVRYVNRHSAFYRRVIQQQGIALDTCKPEDFPILTKRELIDHFDDIVTDPRIRKQEIMGFLQNSKDPQQLYINQYSVINTSGSSGEVGYFIFSQSDWARAFAQVARMHKVALRRIKCAFVGAITGHYAGVTLLYGGQYLGRLKYYDAKAFDINQPLQDLVNQLNRYQPQTLAGYAQALRMLAEQQREGRLNIKPSFIDSGGEVLTEDSWEYIESAFGAPLQNVYAASEFLYMGVGRREFGGLVLLEDDLIFDIEKTATTVTSLFNFTLPLIRYRMNDVLELIPLKHIGWPYRLVKQVVGRMEQAPAFINEQGEKDYISPHVIGELFAKDLRRFQLHVRDNSSFDFRVVFEPDIDSGAVSRAIDELRHQLNTILQEKKMRNVRYEIQLVNELPVDVKTGKFRLIVNDPDNNRTRPTANLTLSEPV